MNSRLLVDVRRDFKDVTWTKFDVCCSKIRFKKIHFIVLSGRVFL